MKESDKARIFSEYVDQMIEGHGEVPEELGEMMTIAAWLMERRDGPSPTFRSRLEVKLRQQWAVAHRKPSRRWPWLPPLWPERVALRRWVLGGALTGIILVSIILLAFPPARSWAREMANGVLRYFVVTDQPTWAEQKWVEFVSGKFDEGAQYVPEDWPRNWTLAQAQAVIDFPLRLPSYLPPAYHRDSIVPFPLPPGEETEEHTYRGITVLYSDGSIDGTIYLREGRITEPAHFPVGQAEVEEVTVKGNPALWIKRATLALGKVSFPPRQITRSIERMNVLLWEEGDLYFQLSTTDLDLPLEEMLSIAESIIESD